MWVSFLTGSHSRCGSAVVLITQLSAQLAAAKYAACLAVFQREHYTVSPRNILCDLVYLSQITAWHNVRPAPAPYSLRECGWGSKKLSSPNDLVLMHYLINGV